MDNKTKVLQVEKKQKQIEDKLKIHLCIWNFKKQSELPEHIKSEII